MIIKYAKHAFILNCFLLFYVFGFNQNKYTLPQLTPQAPNAAGFAIYGEVPVSLSNGIPNISIPLFSIKAGNFELPVSLSYHNNGLKTDEIPSFTGLGWNLNAAGVINYEQRGNPDFAPEGDGMFTHSTYNSLDSLKKFIKNQMPSGSLRRYNYMEMILRNDVDGQFDLYHFNFMGYSGSFYFDTNQNIITVPKSNLKIKRDGDVSFTITDERGNQYIFGQLEYNQTSPSPDDAVSARRSFSNNAAYHLTQIHTAESRNIFFNYTNYPFTYQKSTNYISHYPNSLQYYAECPRTSSPTAYTNFSIQNAILTSITFDEGSIQLDMSTEYRTDIKNISSTANIPYLSKIRILNTNNTLISEYRMHYTNGNRLQLNELIKDSASVFPQKWAFEYYSNGMPVIFSQAKDHWGFYNGASNTNGIPAADYSKLVTLWQNELSNPANRESDYNYSISGVLKKMKYPTGGTTQFNYESNQVIFTDYNQIKAHPFLQHSVPNHTVYLVNNNTNSSASITGSFALGQTTDLSVTATKDYVPENFVYSDVAISTTVNGTDIISSQLGFTGTTSKAAQGVLTLSAGTYYYRIIKNTQSQDNPNDGYASLQVSQIIYDSLLPYPVGGCRIASIENNDGIGHNYKKVYQYRDRIDSVSFINIPYYITRQNIRKTSALGGGGTLLCADCNSESKIHDESVVPMIGSTVEYKYVSELTNDTAGNGKTDFIFTVADNLTEEGTSPYVSPFVASWRGGLTVSKKIFKKAGNSFILLQLDTSVYEFTYPYDSIMRGVKAEYFTYCDQQGKDFRQISETKENYQTEKFYQKGATQVSYDVTGTFSNGSQSAFLSTKHTLATETSSLNSKNETIKEKIKYSFDYDTTSITGNDASAIRNLVRKNVLLPVEKLTVKSISGSDYVIAGTVTTYKPNATVPDRIFQAKITSPVLLSSFSQATITGGAFTMSNLYEERAVFDLYDSLNNILQMHYSNNVYSSFIWDYKLLHPVCQVTNAAYGNIAYTSFESDGTGNWTYSGTPSTDATAITGRKVYNPSNGAITKTITNGGIYIISYWSKNGAKTITGTTSTAGRSVNGWVYYENKGSLAAGSTVTISGSGVIDELRLYPAVAQMTTYTFDPLVGQTSMADANGEITYYEYDAVNRLKNIKDWQGNIVKNFQYNYLNSCGPNCVVLPMQTFTAYNTPSYPVGVFSGSRQYIGIANTPSEYVTKWNSNTANQAIGTLSTNADSLHFNLTLATNAVAPPCLYGLRFYQWDVFTSTTLTLASDSLSYIDFGDSSGTLITQRRTFIDAYTFGYPSVPVRNEVMFNWWFFDHTYSHDQPRTITVFHNETTETISINNTGIGAAQDANLRGYYPEKAKCIIYNGIGNSSDLGIKNFDRITDIEFAGYTFADGFTLLNHNRFRTINHMHKMKWMKLRYQYNSEIASDFRINFPNLRILEIQGNKPNISQIWSGGGFKDLYVYINGMIDGSLSTSEIDLILNQTAAASTIVNGMIALGPIPQRSTASDAAYAALFARGWYLAVTNPNP